MNLLVRALVFGVVSIITHQVIERIVERRRNNDKAN